MIVRMLPNIRQIARLRTVIEENWNAELASQDILQLRTKEKKEKVQEKLGRSTPRTLLKSINSAQIIL